MESLLDSAPKQAKSSLLDNPSLGVGAVYLMRHGSTVMDVEKRSDGWLDMPLSDDGRMGLIPAQQYLKAVPLKRIVASNLKRATETAHIIASGTLSKPEVTSEPEGRTWNLGIIAGTRKRYGRPEVQKLVDNPASAPMGGESFNDFSDRFLPWFNEQTKDATRLDPILYVGSGSNLRLLGQTLFGDPDQLDLDEGGLVALHKLGDEWTCEVVMGGEDQQDEVS